MEEVEVNVKGAWQKMSDSAGDQQKTFRENNFKKNHKPIQVIVGVPCSNKEFNGQTEVASGLFFF